MAAQKDSIILSSLRGGLNDTDPPDMLAQDQCMTANNVEFFFSAIGERRNGCGPIDLTGSGLTVEAVITHLSQWFPGNDVLEPEFIAVGATISSSVSIAARTAGVWGNLVPTDAVNTSSPDVFRMSTQSLNGKLFFSYHSGVDRMHVHDAGTLTVRRTGLAEPAAPTAVDEGIGTYGNTRYFRIRYIIKSGSTILLRSEPSPTLTFGPSGAGAGATVTKPASIGEGETHWELEASTDNALFYRIATTVVGTASVNDETVFATGYAAAGTLSEDVGEYLNLPSAKFLSVDGDRLIFGGHWTDTAKQSQVGWTPVFNDPGVGNDERLPLSVDNTLNLDNYDGGPITGISSGGNGTWYVFKWAGIYKMVRTGDLTNAYNVITISKTRGAIEGSIVQGIDENGASCIYFLDPTVGPSRIGPGGLQAIVGLRSTWGRVNLQATQVVARGVFYPYKQQIHWWTAVDGNNTPNLKLILQVSDLRQIGTYSVGGGWSLATGRIAEATAASVFTERVIINGIESISFRPFIGLTSPNLVQRCDVEDTDAGVAYTATIRTRPYVLAGLLGKWGVRAVSLLGTANSDAHLVIRLVRDYGVENTDIPFNLTPTGSEGFVLRDFDNLALSSNSIIQVELSDS